MKYFSLIIFCLTTISSVGAIETDVAYNLAYRQKNYQLIDEQGDYSLSLRLAMSPKAIWYTTFGMKDKLDSYLDEISKQKKKYDQEFNPFERLMEYEVYEEQNGTDQLQDIGEEILRNDALSKGEKELALANYFNDRLIIEGRDNPINRVGLINALKQVIVEEYRNNGFFPHSGIFHQWAPGFKQEHASDALFSLPFSKLLVALAVGKSYLYMKTGTEAALVNAILKYSRNSLTLPQLFKISYRLNRGDIYLSLLTIENLLSYHWMYTNREMLAPITRLRPINNFYMDRGDKFGSWYHLFGLILYGHVKGNVKGKFVGWVESIGSHIMGGESEPQEDWINGEGAPIGAALRKFVDSNEFMSWKKDRDWTRESEHLNLNEDYRSRLYFAHNQDFSIKLGKEQREPQAQKSTLWVSIKSQNKTLSNCNIDIFTEERNRERNKLIRSYKNITLKSGKREDLYFYSADPSFFYRKFKVKAEIKNCSNSKDVIQLSELELTSLMANQDKQQKDMEVLELLRFE